MVLNLPLELKMKIVSYLNTVDLLDISYTCKSLRQAALKVKCCEECCHYSKKLALCRLDQCNELICKSCFPSHCSSHLIKYSPPTHDFEFFVGTSRKSYDYTYTIYGPELFFMIKDNSSDYLNEIENEVNNKIDDSRNNIVDDDDSINDVSDDTESDISEGELIILSQWIDELY